MNKPSPEIEEYLELLVRFKDGKKQAKTSLLAKELKISDASVSEMLKKLEKKGLIKLTPYKGAELTKKGEELGRRVLRKHRTLEKFLDFIGINKDKVHYEACILEHALSDDVEHALENTMKRKEFSKVEKENIKPISELKQGEEARILFLLGGCNSCRRLTEMGLTPDTKIKLLRKSNLGPLEIEVRNSAIALGRGLSEKVYVEIL